MLRGKFGQIGKDLGDGHITMDAFQQAAFRDHIRSGERIMFLASMGRLKHKRTRNTIAAEETPRSSCPSEAGPTAAPAAESGILNTTEEHQTISGHNIEKEAVVKGVSAPVPHAGTRGATAAGRAPDWPGDNPGVKHVNSGNAAGDRTGFRTLAWSHPRPLSPTAKRHDQDTDSHPRNHGIANGDDDLLPAKGPAEGNLGARAASSGKLGCPSPTARQHRCGRPRSACTRGHQSRSPGVKMLSSGNPDTSTEWAETAGYVPLQVGPTITAPPAKDVAHRGKASPSTLQPPRPASARVLEQGARARKARQGVNSSPATIARRGADSSGLDRGTRRPRGDGGASPGRRLDGKDAPARRDTANACYSTERGSFAASVLNSARALAEFDLRPKGDGSFNVRTKGDQRPKSANAAAATVNAAAGAMFPSAEDVAAETRLMPVGAIHRAFEGRRLAAVQAWDPLAAAAVRAKRAEKMLRRAFLGRTGTNSVETMPAAAPARRRPRKAPGTKAAAITTTENKVGGGTSDRGGGVRGSRKCSSARRVGGPAERSVGRGGSEGDSKSDADWCGSRGSRRDAKRGKESLIQRELYRTEFARAVAAVERIGGRRIVHGAGALSKQAVGGTPAGANVLSTRKRDAVESVSRPSRGSIKTSKSRSASGSSRETSPMRTSRTARTSTATSRSSRCPSSRRGSSTCNSGRGTSVSGDEPIEMRRARLLAELEVLRRRMHDAEGLLREVDRSRPKQRPQTATHAPPKKSVEQRSEGGRASTVATAGNTSVKSSAGYGAFNLGERAMAPRVVTHPANACLDQS